MYHGSVLLIIITFLLSIIILFIYIGMIFRNSTELKHRKLLRQHLNLISSSLKNIEYYIDFGTLLGYHREHDIIIADEDIDFAITADTVNIPKLLLTLNETGCRTQYNDHLIKVYHSTNNNISADIYIYKVEENNIVYYGTNRIVHSKNDIYPTQTVQFSDMFDFDVKIPKNVPLYLEKCYGKDFMIPIYADTGNDGGKPNQTRRFFLRCLQTWRNLTGFQKPLMQPN
jgi:hypothetical protein